MFADDTSFFIEFNNPDAGKKALNEDLDSIFDWSDQWLVKFSPTKTMLMMCSFKKKEATAITFNNVELESIDSHLRLVLSCDLSWSNHIDSIL